jgi:eukaryotic-like serine/threonine-protein kinase
MGVVYKAEDTRLKQSVALKFLPPEFMQDQAARERFFHEAQAASALEHAGICSVHELGEHDGKTFLVMGFYEGETLKQKIDRGPSAVRERARASADLSDSQHRAGAVDEGPPRDASRPFRFIHQRGHLSAQQITDNQPALTGPRPSSPVPASVITCHPTA